MKSWIEELFLYTSLGASPKKKSIYSGIVSSEDTNVFIVEFLCYRTENGIGIMIYSINKYFVCCFVIYNHFVHIWYFRKTAEQ